MKRKLQLPLLAGALLAGFIFATATASGAPASKEHEVAKAVAQLRLAMIAGDAKELDRLTSPLLSYGHSGGTVEDKASFIEALATGASDFLTIDLSGQTITVTGSTAIVRHTLIATTNDKGKQPGNVNLSVLLVWQKQRNAWVLIARQAVKPAH